MGIHVELHMLGVESSRMRWHPLIPYSLNFTGPKLVPDLSSRVFLCPLVVPDKAPTR
jgi:hypothetical protein